VTQQDSLVRTTNVRRGSIRDLAGFLLFSHGWTWLFWLLAAIWGTSIWGPPGVYFFYVGGTGVLLGALVMSWLTGGADGMKDLGRRIVDSRRITGFWWLVILLMFPALALVAAAVARWFGGVIAPFDLSGALNLLAHPLQLLTFLVFILIIGPLPEEIGWRGYLLDRLQLRWNALIASLLLAAIWWIWHLPLFWLPGYYDAFGHAPPSPLDFLYGLVPAAILYTWVYNNTRRSILAVILFHYVQNLTGEVLGLAPEVRQLQLVLMGIAAVAVLLWWGPATLQRRES
jgi:uncharacterized protein